MIQAHNFKKRTNNQSIMVNAKSLIGAPIELKKKIITTFEANNVSNL